MKLDSNNHSIFLLYYHLILVTKYRRKVIDAEISARLKEIFSYIAPNYNITIEEWNTEKDHVHILLKAHSNTELSKLTKEQRKLSKCIYTSNRYYKQKHNVALLHEKIANQRKDFLHKKSREITNSYDLACIEKLIQSIGNL